MNSQPTSSYAFAKSSLSEIKGLIRALCLVHNFFINKTLLMMYLIIKEVVQSYYLHVS